MRTIIAGSRDILDMRHVNDAIRESKFKISKVLCGMAEGPDLLGRAWAKWNHVPWDEYPANWYRYEDIGEGFSKKIFDRTAGFQRNQEMADNADALIAVWNGKSTGTADMIERAKKAGLQIFIWNINDPPKTFRFA